MNNNLSIVVKSKSFQQLFGSYQSSFKGSGLSYAGSRVYAPGDPYHRIDRRSSAKKNELFLKEFEEEKIIKLLIVIPARASLQFGSQATKKTAYIESLMQLLCAAALQHHDRLGFLIQSEEKSWYQPAKQGQQQQYFFSRCWQEAQDFLAIDDVHCNRHAAQTLWKQKCKNHYIIWISDQFPTPEEKEIHALAQQNELLRLQLFDPFEISGTLDDKQLSYCNFKHHNYPIMLNQENSIGYAKKFAQQQKKATQLLSSRNITSLLCASDRDPLQQLLKLFTLHRSTHHR